MQEHTDRKGHRYHVRYGRHLKLYHLKQEAQGLKNQFLFKEGIPEYPKPEFHVSHLKYDTKKEGLRGIRRDKGFKSPTDSLLWWSLAVGPEEMRSAETRLLEKTLPARTEEQAATQQSFLWKFATSPAFKETSRVGSYRFTFPLEEVLKAYSEQFCSGEEPVMRVHKTVLYKQEVQYAVLVHSPANDEQFSKNHLLSDHPKAVCVYRDGRFIWRPEAMCETHSWRFRSWIQTLTATYLFTLQLHHNTTPRQPAKEDVPDTSAGKENLHMMPVSSVVNMDIGNVSAPEISSPSLVDREE